MAVPEVAADPKPTFAPVGRNVRLVDKVVDALTESIVSGQLAAGDRLPSERDLCEQFGVSRPLVREAIGSLNAKGLVESSPNRGHHVTALGRDSVTESLTLYLRGQQLDFSELMLVRTLLEVENAGLAARRGSAEALAAVEASEAAMDSCATPEELSQADLDFHRAIATAGANLFLGVMLDSLRETLSEAQDQVPTLTDEKVAALARRGHARILKALASRDESKARDAMRSHIAESERWMQTFAKRAKAQSAS